MVIARAFLQYHHENGTIYITDCFTHMQVADFLTKSLGAQIHTKLVNITIGDKEMKEITRFLRRDWKCLYDESHNKDKNNDIHETQILGDDLHTDAQGGMLRNRLVDLVNLNCMKIPTVCAYASI
jgi:hypothetical protein